MSEFKAGDKVQVFNRGIPTLNDKWMDGFSIDSEESPYEGMLWVIRDDGLRMLNSINQLRHIPDHYADYPGGADQYTADVATLTEAGMWTDDVNEDGSLFHSREIQVSAIDVARALSRFMPWSQARLGGDK